MCGVTGFVAFKPSARARLSNAEEATNTLRHRGPDATGIATSETVALGHRRLSIIDTSCGGAQPMSDESGRFTLVFNGEIFNFRELARQTPPWSDGSKPLPTSDTEVLLQLLIRQGADCLPQLHGFFALAFLDQHTGELLLARDRFGKKPLLYYTDAECFAFGSEMKSLLAWDIPRSLDYTALFHYLQLNYVPQPWSMLQGVRKLEPGHSMRVTREGAQQPVAYYTLRTRPDEYGQLSYEQAQRELVTRMDEAVRERLVSDVPLGAFLSGGIDSSVVVALASRHTRHLATFSIGYKDNPFFDETAYAKLVANKYGTEHTVFSLSNNDFLEHVHDVLDAIDEPFADSSALPVYILSKYTKRHVTVALSGDGGDEIFAGYNKHAAEWRARQRSWKAMAVRAGAPLWKALPQSRSNKVTNTFRKLHRFAEGSALPAAERYWRWAAFLTEEGAAALLAPGAVAGIDKSSGAARRASLLRHLQGGNDGRQQDFNEVLLTDMNLVLLSDMLVKVDMMSMAASLEIRSPFLSHEVVDFAFGLPAEYKIDGSMKKRIVQDAFRPMLPEELYNRPKKGFEIPLLGWLREDLWPLINDELLSDAFVREQGIFDAGAVAQLKRQLQSSNPADSHATIWALIVFQHWWKRYLAN